MKQIIKKIARYSGTFGFCSWINKNLLKILMYHGLCDPDDNKDLTNFNGKHLNIVEFENHLKLITKYCNPISLKDVILNKELPPNPIVLTFDDGYKNNYTHAFPLLKKYNVPAIIFLTTGFIDHTDYLWSDRLEYILNNAHSKNIDLLLDDNNLSWELSADGDKMKTIRAIKFYMKNITEHKKLSIINKLQQVLGVEYDWSKIPSLLLPLSWDEIREMNESGLISFGSHTVTHPILLNCTPEQQKKEIRLSKQRISEELEKDCIMFAYPNGEITDFNHKTIDLLRKFKYMGAVTTVPGYINNNGRDNFWLNRFGAGIKLEELGTVITGLSRLVGTI